MEAAGGTGQRGPFTSTPREPPPPLDPPKRTDSSTSLSSDSSGEDWLIKVCCPGARHRYRRPVELKKPRRTGFSHSLNKEDDFTETAGGMPLASYQSLPEISTNLSNSPSKTLRSSQSEWANASENWLTQKNIFTAQDVVNEGQDLVSAARFLLERENCFVREVDRYLKHSDFLALRRREMLYKKWFESVSCPILQKIQDKVDNQSSEEIEERNRKQLSLYLNYYNKQGSAFLESYSPSTYDPLFLKTCTDIWKASIPHLCDPLLKEIQGRYIEAGIIQQCDTGKIFSSKEMNELHKAELPLLPLSRQLMNPIEWLKIPAGYMESEIRQKSRKAHIRARQGKEQETTHKEKHILARKARSPERNLLSSSKQRLVWA